MFLLIPCALCRSVCVTQTSIIQSVMQLNYPNKYARIKAGNIIICQRVDREYIAAAVIGLAYSL
jgi:hypothetical protein